MKKLYRAVSGAEWQDIQQNDTFRTHERGLEAKQFVLSHEDALAFQRIFMELEGLPYLIICVELSSPYCEQLDSFTLEIDKSLVVTIQEEDLDVFNQHIIRYYPIENP